MTNDVAEAPLTQAEIDATEQWVCAWCGKPTSHKPRPGTFGVVCGPCAVDGPPNAEAFE